MLSTGAAIPNISDKDFRNLLISVPDEKILKEISEKVKNSFELREKSKSELNSIEYQLG
jgi:type I restriction enzyme M protein